MKAVRTDDAIQCPIIDDGLRARGLELVTLPDSVSENRLVAEVADADLLLMCYTPIPARVINAAPRLRGIVKYGVGIDAIDLDAALRRRLPVVNIPEYAEETVAEGAFALLISLAKKLGPLRQTMQTDGWASPEHRWLARDLAGQTLGIVGVGRIGRSLARMAGAGFRMRVLGYDPYVDADTMRQFGVEKRPELPGMLAECDVVSLHATLSAETHHMIGPRELSAMKPTALLINAARGALVDESALVDALVNNRLGGAGLDVFSQEPLTLRDHPLSPLFHLPNVELTPHLTFYTQEAMLRLEHETLARCDELLAGRPVLVKSTDPRLRRQAHGVVFA